MLFFLSRLVFQITLWKEQFLLGKRIEAVHSALFFSQLAINGFAMLSIFHCGSCKSSQTQCFAEDCSLVRSLSLILYFSCCKYNKDHMSQGVSESQTLIKAVCFVFIIFHHHAVSRNRHRNGKKRFLYVGGLCHAGFHFNTSIIGSLINL